jgi:hypothetical protein
MRSTQFRANVARAEASAAIAGKASLSVQPPRLGYISAPAALTIRIKPFSSSWVLQDLVEGPSHEQRSVDPSGGFQL